MASLVIVVAAVLVLSCGQTDTQSQTDADQRFTPATLVGVSNKTDCLNKDRDYMPLVQLVG